MKKLIAISVVFALVAGAAFAADIAVDVKGGVNLIKGNTEKKPGVTDGTLSGISTDTTAATKPTADGGMPQFRISASGENDDGTFGAFFRYDAGWGWHTGVGTAEGHAWWKPVDALKLLIGGGPDGRFGADGNARWNFYQVAGDVGVAKENWKLSPSFYGGWDDAGLDLIITPVEALEINFGIPFITQGWQKVENVYMKSTFQVAYAIENIGKFAITYKSGLGNKAAVDPTLFKKVTKGGGDQWIFDPDTGAGIRNPDYEPEYDTWEGINGEKPIHDPGQLWLYFNLSAIENLSIDIGLGYTLPKSGKGIGFEPWDDPDDPDNPFEFEGTLNSPIAFGVAAKFDAGDFGVKARTQGLFAGKVQPNGDKAYNLPINVIFDVQPYYAVSEALTVHFSVGIDYTAKSNNEIDKDASYAKVGFHVNPYITIKSSWWAPNFYAGIHVATDGTKYKDGVKANENKDGSSIINWSVPLGIAFSF